MFVEIKHILRTLSLIVKPFAYTVCVVGYCAWWGTNGWGGAEVNIICLYK